MVWSCALDSLSSVEQVKIYARSEEYKVLGTESGVLLLKVILLESGLQTNATIIKHKDELANLPALMGKLSHNVEKFNSSVLAIVLALKRKGATAPDLLHQLVPAYLHCPDKNFAIYVGSKRDKFEEGGHMTALNLMRDCLYKYKTLVDRGQWEVPNSQETQLLAMKCEIREMRKRLSARQDRPDRRYRDAGRGSGRGHPRRSYGNYRNVSGRGRREEGDTKWMTTRPPKEGHFVKTVKDKEYHWCSTTTTFLYWSSHQVRRISKAFQP